MAQRVTTHPALHCFVMADAAPCRGHRLRGTAVLDKDAAQLETDAAKLAKLRADLATQTCDLAQQLAAKEAELNVKVKIGLMVHVPGVDA